MIENVGCYCQRGRVIIEIGALAADVKTQSLDTSPKSNACFYQVISVARLGAGI